MDRAKFISEYAEHVRSGQAALFIGAGVSMAAGYPSWSGLLKDIAKDLKLDLAREADLPGLVQFHLNHIGGTRTTLIQTIESHFTRERPIPRSLTTLLSLPIRTFWTTNYDQLIERGAVEAHKKLDLKLDDEDLRRDLPFAHAALYKMHGSVTRPGRVIIAKGDYELYRKSHPAFLQHLTAQLASKRFLFLGFSFTDPNLANLFTIIRETYGDQPPRNYTVVRRPQRGSLSSLDYKYTVRRHDLWVRDLSNYGIQCVEVADWKELDDLLTELEKRTRVDHVMVSGSYPEPSRRGSVTDRRAIEAVSRGVGEMLGRRNARLISGFGLTVGSAAVAGFLDQLYESSSPNLEESLHLRPFPQIVPRGLAKAAFQARYREDMIRQAGAIVFVGGSRDQSGRLITAPGVLEEFKISTKLGRFPIPVGATGGAAAEIWSIIERSYEAYVGKLPKKLFRALNAPRAHPAKLVEAVEGVLDWLEK